VSDNGLELFRCSKSSKKARAWFDFKEATWGSKDWTPVMEPCRYKYAVLLNHAEGGFSADSSKILACGSLPIAINSKSEGHDVFYGKWLRRNVHYLDASSTISTSSTSTSVMNMTYCQKLEKMMGWVHSLEGKVAARNVGKRARRFASTILGPRLLHEYLLNLFSEVSRLQQLHRSRYAYHQIISKMKELNRDNIVKFYDARGVGRGGVLAAALAYWEGSSCPEKQCHRCCNIENHHESGSISTAAKYLDKSFEQDFDEDIQNIAKKDQLQNKNIWKSYSKNELSMRSNLMQLSTGR